jgi:hypothetical protein
MGQIGPDVTRAAPDVGDGSLAGELGEGVKHPSVERFVLQLVEDLGRIVSRDPVIAATCPLSLRHDNNLSRRCRLSVSRGNVVAWASVMSDLEGNEFCVCSLRAI